MADSHEILQDLKRVASLLGHVPTRREYREHGSIPDTQLERIFGGFTPALIASGMKSEKPEREKKLKPIDVFGRDIRQELTEYFSKNPRIIVPRLGDSTAVVGDLHFPFTNLNTLSAFYVFISIHQPKRIIQVGDLYDMFAHSKFPASRNIYTPDQEMDLARKMAEDFWRMCQELVPGVECIQILGNHDVRPLKRLMEVYPAGERFFNLKPFFEFEGVKTEHDYRQEILIDEIVYHHGYRSKLGDQRDYNLMNSVGGHTHRGGVVFRQIRGQTLWELNAGYMGDPESKALSYTPQKISHWTQGFGWIDAWGPRFIPAGE